MRHAVAKYWTTKIETLSSFSSKRKEQKQLFWLHSVQFNQIFVSSKTWFFYRWRLKLLEEKIKPLYNFILFAIFPQVRTLTLWKRNIINHQKSSFNSLLTYNTIIACKKQSLEDIGQIPQIENVMKFHSSRHENLKVEKQF